MIEQNSNFFDQLDGGWGDLIADTYEEYSNEKYILQFEGTDNSRNGYSDEFDNKINIKIKTDVEKLIMQCQYKINFSELGDYINSSTVVKFPSDVEVFVDGKLSENKYNGMNIHYNISTTNKNMCSASIVLVYYEEYIKNVTRLNYTPYKKRNGNKAKFSEAFKYKIINEFETDPFYDSSFNIDPSEFKPQIDEQLYAIKYVLNN